MLAICVCVLSVVRLCEHVTCVITRTPRLVQVEIVVAGSDQWCWFSFFGSQVVGRAGFSRSGLARSIGGFKERLRYFALCWYC